MLLTCHGPLSSLTAALAPLPCLCTNRFVDSEVDLDEEVKKLSVLATAPELCVRLWDMHACTRKSLSPVSEGVSVSYNNLEVAFFL